MNIPAQPTQQNDNNFDEAAMEEDDEDNSGGSSGGDDLAEGGFHSYCLVLIGHHLKTFISMISSIHSMTLTIAPPTLLPTATLVVLLLLALHPVMITHYL